VPGLCPRPPATKVDFPGKESVMSNPFFYGGQAVIEGVVIRGLRCVYLAVRDPNGAIKTEMIPLWSLANQRIRRVPLIRGTVVLLETMILGVRALNRSAEISAGGTEQKVTVTQPVSSSNTSDRLGVAASMVFALTLGIGIFFLVPLMIARSLDPIFPSSLVSNIIEGLVRLAFLVGYIWGIGRIPTVKRVFEYHGAEHMTIHAYEHGVSLQPDLIRRFPTAHPRCGTAFLLIVILVSIVIFALLGHPPLWIAVISRVLFLPVIAGVSYELIRLSGTYGTNKFARIFIYPGLLLQKLTCKDPDDSQIEVAIAAMNETLAQDARSN